MNSKNKAAVFAVLAAALYAINIPLSKLFLKYVGSTMMAAFLYLGAGIGMLLYSIIFSAAGKKQKKASLTKKDMPYTVAVAEGSWSCKNERVLFNSSVFRSSIQYGDSRWKTWSEVLYCIAYNDSWYSNNDHRYCKTGT